MAIDVPHLAECCVGQASSAAAVLTPLAGPLATRLAGRYQTQALLTLALTLARREDAAFDGAAVDVSGRLTGLDSSTTERSLVTLVAKALRLCLTQFGESETRRVVAEAWPNLTTT